MNNLLYGLILIFGTASYCVGLSQMISNKYSPSVFSRVVWLLLAIISFGGVIASNSTNASILLAIVFLTGNIAICIVSFWKGKKEIGKLELTCLGLLMLSGLIWVIFDAPLISLCVNFVAHFIGAIPTYRNVWKNPNDESAGFWSLFFIASLLSILASINEPIKLMIFPIYFAFFDGSMTFLSLRKVRKHH